MLSLLEYRDKGVPDSTRIGLSIEVGTAVEVCSREKMIQYEEVGEVEDEL